MRAFLPLSLVLVACSAASTEDPTPPDEQTYAAPTPARQEAPAVVVAPRRSLGLAGTPSASDIVATSFEPASPACDDWAAEGAVAIRSVPSRSGSYACKVCATGDAAEIALTHEAGALEAGRYVFTAWVRSRPSTAAPALVTAAFEAETAAGVVRGSAPLAVADAYDRVSALVTLDAAATQLHLRVGALAAAGECVLIDDVTLTRAPD